MGVYVARIGRVKVRDLGGKFVSLGFGPSEVANIIIIHHSKEGE